MKLSPRQARWAGWAIAGLVRFLGRTVRWRAVIPAETRRLLDGSEPVILAFWHGRLLMIPTAYLRAGRRHVDVLISEHGDGELISRAISHFGFGSVRGSTRRGALRGMRELIRRLRAGGDFAFTPDGPRGPAFTVQPGVVDLARRAGYPILPVTFSARRGHTFSSWDGFFVPLPFTRGALCWGEPVRVEGDEDTDVARQRLEERMRALEDRAAAEVGR